MAKHFEKFHPKHKEHVSKELKTYNLSLTIGFMGLGLIILGSFLSCIGYITMDILIPIGLILFISSIIITLIHRKKSRKERKIMQEKGGENEKVLHIEKGFRYIK